MLVDLLTRLQGLRPRLPGLPQGLRARRPGRRWLASLLLGIVLPFTLPVAAQDTLSNQVLQLLTRVNTWTNTNTFYDLRLNPGIPGVTTNRIYSDVSGNLYYNGILVASAGGGPVPHNLLSTTHPDTLPAAVARGGLVVGNATPAWALLTIGANGAFLRSDGTDAAWSFNGSTLTNLSAGNITAGGVLPVLNGQQLTSLNATNLTIGTIPASAYAAGSIVLAALAQSGCVGGNHISYNGGSGQWQCATVPSPLGTVTSVDLSMPAIYTVTNNPVTTAGTLTVTLATQTANTIWAGPAAAGPAAPTFRALVNADLPLTGVGAGTYTKLTVNTAGVVTAGTVLTSLTTDVTGTLPMPNGGTGVAVSADDTTLVGSGAAWVAQTLPNCPSPGALGYTTATNLFNCVTTGGPTHAILSATHTDSLAATVVRGDLIWGNATPAWSRHAIGTAGQLLSVTGGTDPVWSYTQARGTITGSSPWIWTQTWNNVATFNAFDIAVTDTSSSVGSKLLRLFAGAAGTTEVFSVVKSGEVVSASYIRSTGATSGIGYNTGAGGTVTQATNKSTGVTLDRVTGEITMNGAALTGDTTVSFTLTNAAITATDHVVVQHISGGTVGSYLTTAGASAGTATITVRNITTGSLSEAIVLKFTVIKAVTS